MTSGRTTASGWYDDPAGRHPERFWDGDDWTDRVRNGTDTMVDALPPIDQIRDRDPRTGDPRSPWPLRVTWIAVAGWMLALTGAGVVAWLASDAAVAVQLAASQIVLWGVFVGVAKLVSRRYGSGSLVEDYEWRLGLADIGPGLASGFLARVFAGGVAVVLMLLLTGGLDGGTAQTDSLPSQGSAVIVFAFVAVIGAPAFEELFFRGLLQRSLEAALRPSLAVAASSAAFGMVHIVPFATFDQNVATVGSIAVAGAVFGATARLTRRLGPSIIAHAAFNSVAVVVLVATM